VESDRLGESRESRLVQLHRRLSHRAADGRILFGSRGAPYRLGSKISDEQDRHAETHARIRKLTLEWFPTLQGSLGTRAHALACSAVYAECIFRIDQAGKQGKSKPVDAFVAEFLGRH
jgi:hypothetical protein